MPKNSRRKGKAGELEAASVLRDVLGFNDVRRSVQYKGTADSADLEGIPGLHLEVKRVEKLCVPAALDRCWSEARECDVPLLMHRRNGDTRWMATVYVADLPRLIQRLNTEP